MKRLPAYTCILLFLCLSCLSGLSAASEAQAALQKIAHAAGLAQFDTVESIRFTFEAEIGDQSIARGWLWLPKEERVVYQPDADEPVAYQRADLDAESGLREIDQKFVNDLYWLIFPFTVAWDSTVDLEVIPAEGFTGGLEAMGALKVSYPEGVGYTPGDVYEIYYDAGYRVTAWVFRKGGSVEPTRITLWEDYASFGPLELSLNRPAPAGDFRISFSGVEVQTSEY